MEGQKGGATFCWQYVDDCSHYMLLRLLERKDEAATFKQFLAPVEAESSKKHKKLHVLRTDHGGELT